MNRTDIPHYYRVDIPTGRNGKYERKRYDTEDELLADMENIPKDAWIQTVYEHGGYETIIGKEQA